MPQKRPLKGVDSPRPPRGSSPDETFVTAEGSPRQADTDPARDGADYASARQLPPDLKLHCQIYLEENLHGMALDLLSSCLASDAPSTKNYDDSTRKSYCPPPNQIALLGTIIVHPDFTSRPHEYNWPAAAAGALVYLRSLLQTVGPINGRFREAFRFNPRGRHGARGSPGYWGDDHESEENGEAEGLGDTVPLQGKLAREGLWSQGADFFSVIGWAFNCSVVYPKRWEHWRPWLELTLDIIEADLYDRDRRDLAEERRSGVHDHKWLGESLLADYVTKRTNRNGDLRHIMKALFADGDKTSHILFKEVWPKEYKVRRKRPSNKRKRDAVDLDKGSYGGLLDDESVYSSQASEPATPQKRKMSRSAMSPAQQLGLSPVPALSIRPAQPDLDTLEPSYVESIALRHRVFSLISYLCAYFPDLPFTMPDLYESYQTSIKSLPLPLFTSWVTVSSGALPDDARITLFQGILELYMPSSALSPAKVDRARSDQNGTSPRILEKCFLPNAANTISAEDNAKVGILLEELITIVWLDNSEHFSDHFESAVRAGVEARDAKVNKRRTVGRPRGRGLGPAASKNDAEDEDAKLALEMSGKRLRLLASLVTSSGGNHSPDEDAGVVGEQKGEEAEDCVVVRTGSRSPAPPPPRHKTASNNTDESDAHLANNEEVEQSSSNQASRASSVQRETETFEEFKKRKRLKRERQEAAGAKMAKLLERAKTKKQKP